MEDRQFISDPNTLVRLLEEAIIAIKEVDGFSDDVVYLEEALHTVSERFYLTHRRIH